MAEEFCDVGRGITLCYERFGDPVDPPALLVMGLGTQMVAWHEDFCQELAARGFHVVRFDNRDVGRSTHLDIATPGVRQFLRRRFSRHQYTLSDMADDTARLIGRLDLAPAHVIGVSMGGMIAQTVAAVHPEAVRSLVSIMSSTGSRWSGQPAFSIYRYLVRRPPRDRDAYIRRAVEIVGLIGSTAFPRDEEYIREQAGRAFDRGYNPAGGARQLAAIIASGDRTAQLRRIKAPTLVIHGAKDKMVATSGGRATARAIPGARLEIIDGMGHDLPRGAWPQLIDLIADHAHAVDRRGDRPRAAVAA